MHSLKSKMLMVMIPIFIVSLSIIAYINHVKAKEFLVANFQNEAQVKMNLIQSKVDGWLTSQMDALAVIAVSEEATSGNSERQIQYFNQVIKAHPEFEMIIISNDLTGKQTITSDNSKVDISDRGYFKESMAGKTVVSDPLVSRVSGNMVVVIALSFSFPLASPALSII